MEIAVEAAMVTDCLTMSERKDWITDECYCGFYQIGRASLEEEPLERGNNNRDWALLEKQRVIKLAEERYSSKEESQFLGCGRDQAIT